MLVNLKKHVKIEGRWTFVPVPRKNGRFQPEKVPTPGTFYIEWRQDGRRHQEKVGENSRIAVEALRTKQDELDGTNPRPTAPKSEQTLEDACGRYLLDIKATRSYATYRTYGVQTRWFLKNTKKTEVGEIDRDDIMRLFAIGRDEGSDQKTINKRVVVILGALRNAGSNIKLNKGDWPKTADPDPEVFENEELIRFFAACDDRERTLFMTFLYTGFRHMEVATLQWNGDIDWKQNTLRVRTKADLDFSPKSYEWRSVRVPQAMMEILKSWRQQSTSGLVFPTPPHPKRPNYGGEGVDYHMLENCKRIALRAGLNCGRCQGLGAKCETEACCEKFYLHKFRHTFATNMLRSGVDIKSLQTLMGHKSLATTEKYLKSLRLSDMESKVENSTMANLLKAT